MKILELFCGYGTSSFALKQLGIPYECVGYSDIDKYANQCFRQNHSGKELGDATKINTDELEDFDLLTGGFPCQAFSVAGKGLGELDTRGTLFREIIRIAEVKQPRYMLLENVKGLTNKNHKATFDKILSELARIGYFVHWKVLNTKDYGIPQNRERVWFVCFRNFAEYAAFEFPEKEELKIFLKDILEDEVDEKYYLSEGYVKRFMFNEQIKVPQGEAYKVIGTTQNPQAKGTNMRHWVFDDKGCMQSLNATMHKQPPQILIRTNTKKGFDEATFGDGVRLEQPNSKTARGRIIKELSGSLMCNDGRGVITKELWIRKLTPKECFRLQGFLNDEVNLEGLSNTQQYKLAGNGQSVNVVKKIFERMFL